jgi:hypothetical protein
MKMYAYNPMDFSIDGGLFCGIFLTFLSAYYWVVGSPSYTWYNFWVSFAASILLMICSVLGLNATTMGLAGPASAILSANSIVQTIMNALVLGLIPTLM